MTKGNVLIITRKIDSSPNLETLYLAGELISLITIGSKDEMDFIKVRVPEEITKIGYFIFMKDTEPDNYKAVLQYLKNLGQFPIMEKKKQDANPLVV